MCPSLLWLQCPCGVSCCCPDLQGPSLAVKRRSVPPWGLPSAARSVFKRWVKKQINKHCYAWDVLRVPWSLCFNTLRTSDTDLRFYITTVQDGWRKSAFLTRAYFPSTIHFIMQYIEPAYEWSCWRMFIETWPHSELNFRHRASSI